MGAAYTSIIEARPSPLKMGFINWCERLLALRLARCPVGRSATRYVSTSGNDSNDGLTESTPWQTLGKVQTYIDGIAGGACIKFKCGDEWRVTTGINCNTPNISFAAYGTGNRPLFNCFTGDAAGDEMSVVGDGSYLFAGPAAVQWVRNRANPLRAYTRATSQANCAATEGSWFHSGTSLWIRPFGDETIADETYEYVGAASNDDAITINNVDGCRIDGLRGDGWGMNLASPITQRMAFSTAVEGTNEVVVSDCESYYGSTHCFQQYSGSSGGIATFYRCLAGWPIYSPASGETIFNTYGSSGVAGETIFADCETVHGTLPHNSWVTPAITKRGRSVFGHHGNTTTGIPVIALVLRHRTRANEWGAETPAGIEGYQSAVTDIAAINTFIIGEVFEENDMSGLGFGDSDRGALRINCEYRLKPRNTTGQGFAGVGSNIMRAWWLNVILDLDLTNISSSNPMALFNETPDGDTAYLLMQGAHLNVSNFGDSSKFFGLGKDGWTANVSVQTNYQQYVFNSIISRENGTFGLCSGNGNASSRLKNNALRNVYAGAQAGLNWSGDAGEVTLSADITPGTVPSTSSQVYRAGTGTDTLALEYDFYRRPRDTSAPSIGPFEASLRTQHSGSTGGVLIGE